MAYGFLLFSKLERSIASPFTGEERTMESQVRVSHVTDGLHMILVPSEPYNTLSVWCIKAQASYHMSTNLYSSHNTPRDLASI